MGAGGAVAIDTSGARIPANGSARLYVCLPNDSATVRRLQHRSSELGPNVMALGETIWVMPVHVRRLL